VYSPSNKHFTDAKNIFVVFVYSDVNSYYKSFLDCMSHIKKKSTLSIHEFDNKKSLNEYMYVIDSVNDVGLEMKFHYIVVEQPIQLSMRYTNRVEELNF